MAQPSKGGMATADRPRVPDRDDPTAAPGRVLDIFLRVLPAKGPNRRNGLAGQLAEHLGVSPQMIHRYRIGRCALPMDKARLAAEFLDVDPGLFFTNSATALRWILDNRPDDIPCN